MTGKERRQNSGMHEPGNSTSPFSGVLPRGHVLLVEDDELSASYLTSALHHFGCEVTRAIDGADAASAAAGTRFDLILMDYQMPVLDGAHAAALIRRNEKAHGRPPVPIVAVTASTRANECMDAGMDAGSDAGRMD